MNADMHWANAAIAEIKALRIAHRNYERAFSGSVAAVTAAIPGELVCVVGPSRVGKTRLQRELASMIIGAAGRDGRMPVVSVVAKNLTNRARFRTKEFTEEMLQALQHPIYGVARPDDRWGIDLYRLLGDTSEGTLIKALTRAFKIRGTKYLFVDETQHTRYAEGHDWEAAAVLDSWKCLAEETGLVLVVIGAYPLIDVLQLCPHLLGRKHQVHFPRYGAIEDDLTVWDQILETYTARLRLPPGVKTLREWRSLLYPPSFGCIGSLEGWLRSSLGAAAAQNAEFLTKEHLLMTRKPRGDLEEMAAEIAAGEHALQIGIEGEQVKPPNRGKAVPERPKRRGRPFQRKPRRYRTGGRV